MLRKRESSHPSIVLASRMLILTLVVALLWIAKGILIPLAFAGLFAMLLYPVCKAFESNGVHRIIAISLTLLLFIAAIVGILLLLSTQIYNFIADLENLVGRLEQMLFQVEFFLYSNFNIQFDTDGETLLKSTFNRFMDSGVLLLKGTINTFVGVFQFLGLVPVYIFLFLLYRDSFKDFFLFITPFEKHRMVSRVFDQVQKVVQSYLTGLVTVMGIVAVMNTIWLLVIGVEYAIFFGVFAALLMIIPYIGVFIGSTFPALFALLTMDNPWNAVAVIAGFSFIQFLEGNFITPRITGNKVQINALAAIVALVIGGYLWGPAGMIIFMPLTAMAKVVLDNIPGMRPYGYLLGVEMYGRRTGIRDQLLRKRAFYIAPAPPKKPRDTSQRK